jgi:mono/diheme cytochrome c family protein
MESAMIAAVAHVSGAVSLIKRLATLLGRSLCEVIIARATRRALDELPDDVLRDIGLTRSDIDFVARAFASGQQDPTRDELDPANRSAAVRRAPQAVFGLSLAAAIAVSTFVIPADTARAQDAQIARGKYLVNLGGCHDCHTPGYFFGKPDMTRFLGGSEVGFEIPGLGVFHGPNLTPDQETGLGKWSTQEIATAITTGQRPDGRVLAPIMPWHAFANLTGEDVRAIVAFLKSLSPVKNKVPGPFGPSEKSTSFVMKIVPPEAAAKGDPTPK